MDRTSPPGSVCILRLSALGDVCHVLPVVRSLQRAWPFARFVWIVGRPAAALLDGLDGVELVPFDKAGGLRAHRELRRALRDEHFDLLLHMQLALRASLVSTHVRAPRRMGYDRSRSRELQSWFVAERATAVEGPAHVMDVMFGFAAAAGVSERDLRWDLPIDDESREYATRLVAPHRPTLVISPCSSHSSRSWSPERYALLADHATQRHGMQVILCGGESEEERRMGAAIESHVTQPVTNTIGSDTLKKLLAVLEQADLLLSPDSGPVHMATAVHTSVLGLYAGTDSRRSGPYHSSELCVDRFQEAALRFEGRPASELRWGKKIDHPRVMDLIEPDEVRARLDTFMAMHRSPPRSVRRLDEAG